MTTEEQQTTPPQTSPLPIVLGIVAALGLAGTGFFFFQNQTASDKLTKAEQDKDRLYQQISELELNLSKIERQLGDNERGVAEKEAELDRLISSQRNLNYQLEEQIQTGQAKVEVADNQRDIGITLTDKILFNLGDTHLSESGAKVIDELAASFTDGEQQIVILGHTDSLPPSAELQQKFPSNWELGAQRAISIVKYLRHKHDIAPERLQAASASQYRPISDNGSDEGRAANRRIEIMLLGQ